MNTTLITPVLFLIYNREDVTRRVFNAIKKAKPKYLYIAADGPRNDKTSDNEKCNLTRIITEIIDWPCTVKRLYREENLGCKIAVSSAINWFFDNVEEGIILEDDCLPDPSFFNYCSSLLKKYRNNKKVMHIGSNYFQEGESKIDESIYFSKYSHIWGWATWRRAWKKYSVDISDWNKSVEKIYKGMGVLEKIFWSINFNSVVNNKINTWDYQWLFCIWKNDGMCICPNKNLVINIGIGNDSTHTKFANKPVQNARLESMGKIIFPNNIKVNVRADSYTLRNVFGVSLCNLIMAPLKLLKKYTNV
jgi:hypothetical protein